jgi:hypothetical protein
MFDVLMKLGIIGMTILWIRGVLREDGENQKDRT